jgi:hypothetical protein
VFVQRILSEACIEDVDPYAALLRERRVTRTAKLLRKTFRTAGATVMGIELVHVVRKGQLRPLRNGSDAEQFHSLVAQLGELMGQSSRSLNFVTELPLMPRSTVTIGNCSGAQSLTVGHDTAVNDFTLRVAMQWRP